MVTMTEAGPGWIKEFLLGLPMWVLELKHLGHFPLASQATNKELHVSVWDAGVAGGGFTCSATVSVLPLSHFTKRSQRFLTEGSLHYLWGPNQTNILNDSNNWEVISLASQVGSKSLLPMKLNEELILQSDHCRCVFNERSICDFFRRLLWEMFNKLSFMVLKQHFPF